MTRTRSHEKLALLRRPASPGMCVPFAGVSFDNPYQAHFLYHPVTPRRPGRVRDARNCVNLRHYFLHRVSAPVFSDSNRADTPGQPIFRSLFSKRNCCLRRAIRCGGGSGSRTDRPLSAIHNISFPGRPSFAISSTTICAAVIRPDLPFYGHPDEKDGLYGSAETFAPRSGFNRLKITAATFFADAVYTSNSSNRELRHFKTASVISSPDTCSAAVTRGLELHQSMLGMAVVCAGDFYTWMLPEIVS